MNHFSLETDRRRGAGLTLPPGTPDGSGTIRTNVIDHGIVRLWHRWKTSEKSRPSWLLCRSAVSEQPVASERKPRGRTIFVANSLKLG